MTAHFADITRQAAIDGTISDAEVLQMRATGWADGKIQREEAEAGVRAAQASRALHGPWVQPPATRSAFRARVRRLAGPEHLGFTVRRADTGALVGVVAAACRATAGVGRRRA